MRSWVVGVAVLAFVSVGACASEGGTEAATSSVTAAPSPDADLDPNRWLDLLSYLPDTAEHRSEVRMVDFAGQLEALGLDVPPADADEDELYEFLQQFMQPAPTRVQNLGLTQSLTQDLPLDGRTIDYLERFGRWAGATESVVTDGSFDPAVADELRPLLADALMPSVRVVPDALLVASDEARLDAMVAADEQGTGLSANEDFAAMAEVLGRPEVYSAILTDHVFDGSSAEAYMEEQFGVDRASAEEYLAGTVLLDDVTAYATAWGTAGDGRAVNLLVLVSADEDSAEANSDLLVERLETEDSTVSRLPFADLVTVDAVEVDGRVTVFELTADQPDWLHTAMFRRDPVILNGPPTR